VRTYNVGLLPFALSDPQRMLQLLSSRRAVDLIMHVGILERRPQNRVSDFIQRHFPAFAGQALLHPWPDERLGVKPDAFALDVADRFDRVGVEDHSKRDRVIKVGPIAQLMGLGRRRWCLRGSSFDHLVECLAVGGSGLPGPVIDPVYAVRARCDVPFEQGVE
jgi:hypothetical protein